MPAWTRPLATWLAAACNSAYDSRVPSQTIAVRSGTSRTLSSRSMARFNICFLLFLLETHTVYTPTYYSHPCMNLCNATRAAKLPTGGRTLFASDRLTVVIEAWISHSH